MEGLFNRTTHRLRAGDYPHSNEKHMKRFKVALDYLAAAAHERAMAEKEAEWERFKAQAKTWRKATAKPAMPEAAREHRVLVEYSFQQKDTDRRSVNTMLRLKVFPTGPEGEFNAATWRARGSATVRRCCT
jgi:hypothetical protein